MMINKLSILRHSLIPPILVGAVSFLGICTIMGSAWISRQNVEAIPTQTLKPFKYAYLASETPIPTEIISTAKAISQNVISRGDGPIDPMLVIENIPSVQATASMVFSERCQTPAAEYLEPVRQAVKSFEPNHELSTAWILDSTDQEGLWFISAKIRGSDIDTGTTSPGVWALLFYSEGYFDVYSINNVAMEFTSSAWGEGSDPPITMENDGAQVVYNCAFEE